MLCLYPRHHISLAQRMLLLTIYKYNFISITETTPSFTKKHPFSVNWHHVRYLQALVEVVYTHPQGFWVGQVEADLRLFESLKSE